MSLLHVSVGSKPSSISLISKPKEREGALGVM